MFRKVERSSMGEAIRDQVLEAIASGTLKPGQRVPTERELAAAFQVSRPALREGLKALVFTGVLERRVGRGTFVAAHLNHSILRASIQLVSVFRAREAAEVVEARRAIECALARLAASRRTEDDLAAMDRILVRLAACGEDDPERAGLDFEFHAALGAAAHSGMLHSLQTSISEKILAVMREAVYLPRAGEAGHRDHLALLAAIRDGDGERAAGIMDRHLAAVEDWARSRLDGSEGVESPVGTE